MQSLQDATLSKEMLKAWPALHLDGTSWSQKQVSKTDLYMFCKICNIILLLRKPM